jgi:hypothetical protein
VNYEADPSVNSPSGEAVVAGQGMATGTATDYMDTALLLASRTMRQTTLDIIFARSHFVFTDSYELRDFASELPTAAARNPISSARAIWLTILPAGFSRLGTCRAPDDN